MTEIDLDKLEALADAATPGEWFRIIHPRDEWTVQDRPGGGGVPIAKNYAATDHQSHDNGRFIAAANPATIKSLIASAREDAAEIERLRGLLKPFAVYYEINDLDERLADDAIEVPVGDLRAVYRAIGPRAAQMDGEG